MLGIQYVYLVELRPHNDFSNGFILNQDELLPTAIETLEAIKVVVDAILEDNGIYKNSKLFVDDTTSPSSQIEQSALHLVKSQPITNRPTPININVSVSNMLDVKVQQPSFNNNFHQFSNFQQNNNFIQTSSTFKTFPRTTTPYSTTPYSTTTTMFLPTIPVLDKTTRRLTKSTTTESTTQPITTEPTRQILATELPTHKVIDDITFETTQLTTESSTQTPIQFSPFADNVAAAISIVAHTEHPPITSTKSNDLTTKIESTQDLSFTQRQQLSEELLRKQLLRIQELNSLQTSTLSSILERTTLKSEYPTTSLVFTSSRRYGPRFLTPPTRSSRRPTPLSYSQPTTTTPLPRRLPPLVPPRLGASVNIQPHFAIAPTTILESTTNRPCRDRKYSCIFWITADPYACQDQKTFMENNCRFSCQFCSI